MCAGCPQEFRWRRRVAWPGCLQRTRIPRGSLPLASRRREVFVPRKQCCGSLPTRPRRLLSPSAVGRLAAGAAGAVEEAVGAGRVGAERVEAGGAVEGVAPVAVRAEAVEAEAEGLAAELAEAGGRAVARAAERVAARVGSTPAALSITR